MRSSPIASIVLFAFLCAGCAPAPAPSIRFIGVSAGTLDTEAEEMEFTDRFATDEQNIVGIVVFEEPSNGARVQATWFSPDDRRMPLGRTTIDMASGATIARFSFASQEPWQAAPYQLRIDAMTGEGEKMRTESGSFTFYIGMEQKEIDVYLAEYDAWKKVDADKRAAYEEKVRQEQAIVDAAKTSLNAEYGFLMLQHDLTRDGSKEYLIGTLPEEEMMPSGGGGPGVLAGGNVDQFLLHNGSGGALLSLRTVGRYRAIHAGEFVLKDRLPGKGQMYLSVLPSGTFVLTWEDEKNGSCSLEVRPMEDGMYQAMDPVCVTR